MRYYPLIIFIGLLFCTEMISCKKAEQPKTEDLNISYKYTLARHVPIFFSVNADSGKKLSWHFGDGGYGEGNDLQHTYNDTGSYLIEVTDEAGKTLATKTVFIDYITRVYGLAGATKKWQKTSVWYNIYRPPADTLREEVNFALMTVGDSILVPGVHTPLYFNPLSDDGAKDLVLCVKYDRRIAYLVYYKMNGGIMILDIDQAGSTYYYTTLKYESIN